MYGEHSYEALFNKYRDDSAILRMEKYALWSLPTLFADPDLRSGKQQPVERDYQSVGAILTNSLASKLSQLLFPSNQSFFRLSSKVNTAVMANSLSVPESALSSAMAQLENEAYPRMFLRSSYAQVVQAMKLLIVTGNALMYRDSDRTNIHTYSLRNFSLLRDGTGKVLDIVLCERTTVSQVPAEAKAHFSGRQEYDCLKLYTRIKREKGTVTDIFVVTQQIEDFNLSTREEYPEAVNPYIPVAWNLVSNENYGRGLVEDYAGDFAKLSELSEALALYEIEACRVLNMAKPGSGADIDSMADAESGQWVSGDPTAVGAYEGGNAQKIEVMLADLASVFQRLAPAFMYGGNTRDAERVTAEEIRQQAEEANTTFGGTYSSLADSMHIPLAHILCNEVNPQFVQEVVRGGLTLTVLTGVAALGRSSDVNKLLQVAQVLGTVLPILAQASQRMDPDRIINKVFEGFGLDVNEYSFTEDELLEKQEQQSTAALPPGIDPNASVSAAEAIQGVL